MPECVSCSLNEQAAELPLRERLYMDEHWRVTHGWSSLPGWLIVISRRHAASLSELSSEEMEQLGPILRAASVALHEIVRCEKTYVMLFAEAEGHQHVHFHIVPRMAEWDDDERSTTVFRFLNAPESAHVPVHERERLASEIGERMATALAG